MIIGSWDSVNSIIEFSNIAVLAHYEITGNCGIVGRVIGCEEQGQQAGQWNVGEYFEGANVDLELQHAKSFAVSLVDEAAGEGLLSASHVNPNSWLGEGVLVHAVVGRSVEEGHGEGSDVATLRESCRASTLL